MRAPSRGQPVRDRAPDALRAAGDDRDLPLERSLESARTRSGRGCGSAACESAAGSSRGTPSSGRRPAARARRSSRSPKRLVAPHVRVGGERADVDGERAEEAARATPAGARCPRSRRAARARAACPCRRGSRAARRSPEAPRCRPSASFSSSPLVDRRTLEPSRPMPDSLTPPKGATSVERSPVLMPTMPYSSASPTRQMRPTSRRRSTPRARTACRWRSARPPPRWRSGRCRRPGRTSPRELIAIVGGDAGQDRSAVERPAELEALAAEEQLGAAVAGVLDVPLDLLERRARRSAGRRSRPRAKPSATTSLRTRVGEARRRTRRRSPSCTSIRFAEMHVWPELRNLQSDGPGDGGVEVGVVEDDERRVAAELERDLLHLCRALRA